MVKTVGGECTVGDVEWMLNDEDGRRQVGVRGKPSEY